MEAPSPDWQQAQTFGDLTDTMVRFLMGELSETPVHSGRLDDESEDFIPWLVAINRAGFLTCSSQPTGSWPGGEQLAFVEGYTDESTARLLVLLAEHSSIGVAATGPGETGTRRGHSPHHPAMEGYPSPRVIRRDWGPRLSRPAFRAIRQSWHLIVFDTNDHDPMRIWHQLCRILGSPVIQTEELFPLQSPRVQ